MLKRMLAILLQSIFFVVNFAQTPSFTLVSLPPSLNLTSRFNITKNLTLFNPPNTSYVSMETTNFYVTRLTNGGRLEVFDISTYDLKFRIFGDVQLPFTAKVASYDFLDKQNTTFIILTEDQKIYLYNISTGTLILRASLTAIDQSTRNGIQFVRNEILMSTFYKNETCLSRRMGSTWAVNTAISYVSKFNVDTFNIKVCKVNENDISFSVAFWKRNCFVFVLKCSTNAKCTQTYFFNNTGCNSSEYGSLIRDRFQLSWNFNCKKIMFESKNEGIKIMDLSSTVTVLAVLNITLLEGNLNGFWFLDEVDQYVGVSFPNGTFLTYELATKQLMQSATIQSGKVTGYSRIKRKLFITIDLNLYVYDFSCTDQNLVLTSTGVCFGTVMTNSTQMNNTQNSNTTVNSTSNSTINETDNTSNTTTNSTALNKSQTNNTQTNETQINGTQTNDTQNNDTNFFDDSTSDTPVNDAPVNDTPANDTHVNTTQNSSNPISINNKTNNPSPSNPSNNSTLPSISANKFLQPQFQHNLAKIESALFNIIQKLKLKIGLALAIVFNCLKLIPASSYFMRFINFWQICTMYLIAGVDFPEYLNQLLLLIYSSINMSVLSLLDIQFHLLFTNQEKFAQIDKEKFGFSSDIFNSNFQNATLFFLSSIIIGFLYFLSLKLPSDSCFKIKLQTWNFPLMLSGQYVSIINSFIFNFTIIVSKSYQIDSPQKFNISLHNIMFCFSSFVSGVSFMALSRVTKTEAEKKAEKREKMDWIFDCQCNALLPMITITRNIPLFLTFNMIFSCIPIYTSLKQQNCKWQFLLKALYFPLINLGVISLYVFTESRFEIIYHSIAISITLLMFVGAIHETLQFLIRLVFKIVIELLSGKKRVAESGEPTQTTMFTKHPKKVIQWEETDSTDLNQYAHENSPRKISQICKEVLPPTGIYRRRQIIPKRSYQMNQPEHIINFKKEENAAKRWMNAQNKHEESQTPDVFVNLIKKPSKVKKNRFSILRHKVLENQMNRNSFQENTPQKFRQSEADFEEELNLKRKKLRKRRKNILQD